jgi:hypothetical protein
LVRRFVGKSYGENLLWPDVLVFDQVSHPVGDNARFSAAGSSED